MQVLFVFLSWGLISAAVTTAIDTHAAASTIAIDSSGSLQYFHGPVEASTVDGDTGHDVKEAVQVQSIVSHKESLNHPKIHRHFAAGPLDEAWVRKFSRTSWHAHGPQGAVNAYTRRHSSGDECALERLESFAVSEFEVCFKAKHLGCMPCTTAPGEKYPYLVLTAASSLLACMFFLTLRTFSRTEALMLSPEQSCYRGWVKPKELPALHVARFVAALHKLEHDFYFFAGNSAFLHNFCAWGFTQVELFFFLSGFVHAYAVLPACAADTPTEGSTIWSAQRWLWRAYPMHLAVHVLGLVVVPLAAASAYPLFWDMKSQLQDLWLVTSWNPGHYGSTRWNLPVWFMSTLIALGFTFPVWLSQLRHLNAKGCIAVIFICAMLTAVPYAVQRQLGFNIFSSVILDKGAYHFMSQAKLHPLSQYPIYVGGMAAAQLHVVVARSEMLRIDAQNLTAWIRRAGAASAVCILLLCFAATTPWRHFLFWQCGGLLPVYVVLVLGLAGGRDPLSRAIGHSSLRYLQQLTLPLFLLQHPIVQSIQILGGEHLLAMPAYVSDFLQVCAIFTACIFASTCLDAVLGAPPANRSSK